LTKPDCSIHYPWEQHFHAAIEEARGVTDWPARFAAFKQIERRIGAKNVSMIRSGDIVIRVLNGAEVDSGTASDLGFGTGIGKTWYA